jgi:predicted dienelactone hydrolase
MKRLFVAIGLLWLLGLHAAGAVGFQWASAPDPGQSPLQIAIWYPSTSAATGSPSPAFDMDVAVNGALPAGRHPLIVMSHGTGGMALNSYDTAAALADAGFVVVAVTHTGDNYQDQSTAFTRRNFADRPRHVSRVIDFMLGAWPGRGSIDPDRIGLFGHSAGGTTVLIDAGGISDFSRAEAFCRDDPTDWGCQQARQHGSTAGPADAEPISEPDKRIKAVVVAAPALAVTFQPKGLAGVTVPVQLWVGAEDELVHDAPLVRTLLPTPPDYHLVPHGGHFAYLAPCNDLLRNAAPAICADPKGFDRVAFLRGFHRSVIAFYRQHLNIATPAKS